MPELPHGPLLGTSRTGDNYCCTYAYQFTLKITIKWLQTNCKTEAHRGGQYQNGCQKNSHAVLYWMSTKAKVLRIRKHTATPPHTVISQYDALRNSVWTCDLNWDVWGHGPGSLVLVCVCVCGWVEGSRHDISSCSAKTTMTFYKQTTCSVYAGIGSGVKRYKFLVHSNVHN